jgi:hypothetical protein
MLPPMFVCVRPNMFVSLPQKLASPRGNGVERHTACPLATSTMTYAGDSALRLLAPCMQHGVGIGHAKRELIESS